MSAWRILFAGGGTGGHLYPAIALAEAFLRRDPATEIFFVGARRGVEARVLPERGFPHELLPFEPIRRSRPWQNWRLLPAAVPSIGGLNRFFRSFRPQLVVGTGGYASGPAVALAVLGGVPTAVQEQNSYPGLTTRWLAGRVRQIHLAFPEARTHLRPGRRTEVFEHGNPISPPELSIDRAVARERFGLGAGFVVLVVGGSQGARAINEALLADLRAVAEGRLHPRPRSLEILWATGPNQIDAVRTRLEGLGHDEWVHPVPYISDMTAALASADLAVSRAGAMSLAELTAWGIPAVLVPYPYAAANHQQHNAAALRDAGAARMITESDLLPGRLWAEIEELGSEEGARSALARRALERGRPDAADRIVAELVKLLDA
jgi:UDP-N-acetylglucosamine--N-acetylmuramyl-(pentapeptide) pyrophosphoryl-undecaprenol N-acetylglucosamine transferase